MKRFNLFNLLGVAFLIAALYLGYGAVTAYLTDVSRQEWTHTTAVVTEVDSREIRRSGRKHRTRYETVYDISYTYQAADQEYTGQITGSYSIRVPGEEITVKYDPEAPGDSTARLEPSLYDLIVPLIIAVVFGVIGYFTSGLWALLRRRKEPAEPEPPETYEPEPFPEETEQKRPNHLKGILLLVLVIAFMIGFVKVVTNLGEKRAPVAADAVQTLMLRQGYTPTDATQVYADSWQMPLEKVLCVQEEDLLILFIETESNDVSTDLVNRLYGYSLDEVAPEPELEHRQTGSNFVVHTMEAGGRYAMHIRVGETVAYVQCGESRAAEVIALLDSIGYYH